MQKIISQSLILSFFIFAGACDSSKKLGQLGHLTRYKSCTEIEDAREKNQTFQVKQTFAAVAAFVMVGLPLTVNVELETVTDERIIGGFKLEFNNNLVDASILRDLNDIKKQFGQNIFVQNIR